jgi:hypothetical protein
MIKTKRRGNINKSVSVDEGNVIKSGMKWNGDRFGMEGIGVIKI